MFGKEVNIYYIYIPTFLIRKTSLKQHKQKIILNIQLIEKNIRNAVTINLPNSSTQDKFLQKGLN